MIMRLFCVVMLCAVWVWAEGAETVRGVEFSDLLKEIALPKSCRCTVHDERFLAEPGTFVDWETDGVSEVPSSSIVSGLGGLGRIGSLYIRFDGKSMTKVLHKVVEEVPWGISWSGTFHLVYGIYLSAAVSSRDYVSIVNYIEKKKWGKVIKIPEVSGEECNSTWVEIRIPGYRTMWMNDLEDFGNSCGSVHLTFVFEKPDESRACRLFEG